MQKTTLSKMTTVILLSNGATLNKKRKINTHFNVNILNTDIECIMSEKYQPPFKEPEQECLDPIIAATTITETQDEHKDDTSSSFNQPIAHVLKLRQESEMSNEKGHDMETNSLAKPVPSFSGLRPPVVVNKPLPDVYSQKSEWLIHKNYTILQEKNNHTMETSQLCKHDNNISFSSMDASKQISKIMSDLTESRINYEDVLTPMQNVTNHPKKITKEEQKNQTMLTEHPADQRQVQQQANVTDAVNLLPPKMDKIEFLAALGLVPTDSLPSLKKKKEESLSCIKNVYYCPPISSADKEKKNYLQMRPRGCPPKPNEFSANTICKTDTMSPPKDGFRPTSSSYEGKELNIEELKAEEFSLGKRTANNIDKSEWQAQFKNLKQKKEFSDEKSL